MKKFPADFAGYYAVRGARLFFSGLPHESALAIGGFLGRLLFYFSRRRRVAYADLKAALGPRFSEKERWQIVRSHYAHLGRMLAEILRLPLLNREHLEKMIRIHDRQFFYDAIGKNQGVILLAAHFGNWELMQAVPGRMLGSCLHILVRNQKLTRLNGYLNKLRENNGSVAFGRGIGIRYLFRSLQEKKAIGVLGDQDAGRDRGLILPFFGRKTTLPTGAFELSLRTGALVVPCFIVRRKRGFHDFYFEKPLEFTAAEDHEAAVEKGVRQYVAMLEAYIRRFPSQWLWESKRWKYSWTKRILILSDGKPGHVKQSEAVHRQFERFKTQYSRPGMEYPTKTLEVRFKSRVRRILFPWFVLFVHPWAQGRLSLLRPFFTKETYDSLIQQSADFIISAGAGLVPVNLYLARDFCAKSIVIMKPGFPFNRFRYDLAVVPVHDDGCVPDHALRTILSPSLTEPDMLSEAAEKLKPSLRDPHRIKLAVFLGGPTRRFKMDLDAVAALCSQLEKFSEKDGDFAVTTSRRTPRHFSQFLKERLSKHPACQLLVIAEEDKRSEIAGGMMALAEILIVTEDSIAMISEAVRTGKKVIVLDFGSKGLPKKHIRFKEILKKRGMILTSRPEELCETIRRCGGNFKPPVIREEEEALQRRLQEIL